MTKRGCFSIIVKIILYINAIVTILVILSHTIFNTKKRIHPDYSYAIEKHYEFDGYILTATSGVLLPDRLSYIGLLGICLDGEKLYVQYAEGEYYLFHLHKIERLRLKELPEHIKLIDPKIFWNNL